MKKKTKVEDENENDDNDYKSVKKIAEDEELALQIMNIMPK